jgi:hypothetical protein
MRILTTIILLGLLSCQERQSTTAMVKKYNHDKLMDTLRFEIIKSVDYTKTSVIFKGQLTDTVYYFLVDNENKSEIEFMGHKSKLVDRKAIEIGKEKIEIFKYRYDEENSSDEELDFYLTSNGDILGLRELAWNGYEIFLMDNNQEIVRRLTSDTTDFFKYNYRFKYM